MQCKASYKKLYDLIMFIDRRVKVRLIQYVVHNIALLMTHSKSIPMRKQSPINPAFFRYLSLCHSLVFKFGSEHADGYLSLASCALSFNSKVQL